ncbi:MAG: NAD-dependent dehydratase [Betaproteobacteria bacterium SG8_41]|nr:MAG: NAD-dependent dehydratase [Betaproteobacteria bacterium SG8_41]
MKRLLIVGCGDIARRLIPLLQGRYRIYALSRTPQHLAPLRSLGVTAVRGDLDVPDTLGALAGLAHDVVHLAPPPDRGARDTRTAHLIAALAKGSSLPQQFVYISTSGVYGDCRGELVAETRTPRPGTERARRRADAEGQLREWGRRSGVRVVILRVPGIYAADRLPVARIERGTPALAPAEDAFVNHVHADDLARIVMAALYRGGGGRMYNASDDAPIRMGDYFDLVAEHFGLPHPPRVTRAEAESVLSARLLSFMNESRRLTNRRLKNELRMKLRYPTVRHGIAAARADRPSRG